LHIDVLNWAKSQTKNLIRSHRHQITIWTGKVCDGPRYDPNEWQAPRFLLMKPVKNDRYDPARATERVDADRSSAILEALADDYVIRLEVQLRHAVGDERVKRAIGPVAAANGREGAIADSDTSTAFKESGSSLGSLSSNKEAPEEKIAPVDGFMPSLGLSRY
jgi:hypothetical protein